MDDSADEIYKLKKVFDTNIYSIVKYGFGKRNILIVLNDVSTEYLNKIKPYLLKLKKDKNIVVIGKNNISPKCIGVDFLNIKLTSVVIYGAEIFSDSEIDPAKIKRQIKYEANRLLINLRNEYLSFRWPWHMKKLLYSAVPRVLPLIVAHLYLKGEKIPNAIPDTINRYLKHNEDAIVLMRIKKDMSSKETDALFNDFFLFLENLNDKI
jgi:hypothetical protein